MALFAAGGASCDPVVTVPLGHQRAVDVRGDRDAGSGRAQFARSLYAAMTATIPAKISKAGTGLLPFGPVVVPAADDGGCGLRGF